MSRPGRPPSLRRRAQSATGLMDRSTHVLLLVIFLASCAPSASVSEATATTPATRMPTFSETPLPASTRLPTSTVVPPASTVIQAPCDPLVEDFCITDGYFALQRPIFPPGDDSVERTYPYASTANGARDPHHGVEFESKYGTPVHAAAGGAVVFAGQDDAPIYSPWRDYYGNLIVIEHGNELFTLYAHLSNIDVDAGDLVSAGEKIGEVGRSGVAIGAHLHFEVRRGEAEDYFSTVNPELWLIPRQSEGVISLSLLDANSIFQQAEITVQRYSDSNDILGVTYLDSYHPSLATGYENAAVGELPLGRYRISLFSNGRLYERWVEVESGKLTQVAIVVE